MENVFIYKTPIGHMCIAEENDMITRIYPKQLTDLSKYNINETKVIKKAACEISEYFEGDRKEFDFPIKLKGTNYQKKIWRIVKKIPYANTFSYQQIAKIYGNIRASRAVGNAVSRNKILIVIPCHRVILSNGKLGGFALGKKIKSTLLDLEKNI